MKKNIQKTLVFISGMTCVGCERIIEGSLKNIKGIKKINVSVKKGIAEITHVKGQNIEEIIEKINKLGYKATLERAKNKINYKEWFLSVLILCILFILYQGFSQSGIMNNFQIDLDQISYLMAILIGIVASMSTCLMVVGSVVVSFSAKYKTEGSLYKRSIEPHLLFHLGRILGFGVLGGILGLIGSVFSFSTGFTGFLTIFVACVLFLLGLNIIGVKLNNFNLSKLIPKYILKKWKKMQKNNHFLTPVILGVSSFFLPCGFTQSMQLFAAASGSFIVGGLIMMIFAIGTFPVLFGLGIASSRFQNVKNTLFTKTVGLSLIIFSLMIVSNGLALMGIDMNFYFKKSANATIVNEEFQTIRMKIDYNGFSPNVFTLKNGVPVKWIIDGAQVTNCTNEIIVPSLNIRQKIHSGENLIEFVPNKTGEINFSCWMGMVKGKFIIIEDNNKSLQIKNNTSTYLPNSSCNGSCGKQTCGAVQGKTCSCSK